MLRRSLLTACFSIFIFFASYSATFFSQGTGDFSTLSNWNTDRGGTGTSPTATELTDGTNIFIVQDGHIITLDQDIDIAGLTVGDGASGTLTIGNSTTALTMIIQGDLLIDAGATLNLGAFAASHFITLQGNLTNDGTLDLHDGFTRLATLTLAGTINLGGTNTPQLGNVTFQSGTSTALVALDIEGNVVIETATTFADGDFTHTVGGNWTENGSGQRTGAGTINFDAGITQQVTTAAVFNNVIFSGGATVTVNLTGSMTVQGDLTIDNSTSVITAVNQTIRGNFTTTAGTSFERYFH